MLSEEVVIEIKIKFEKEYMFILKDFLHDIRELTKSKSIDDIASSVGKQFRKWQKLKMIQSKITLLNRVLETKKQPSLTNSTQSK